MWWILGLIGFLLSFFNDSSGGSSVLYALVGALIGVFIQKLGIGLPSSDVIAMLNVQAKRIQELKKTISLLETRLGKIEQDLFSAFKEKSTTTQQVIVKNEHDPSNSIKETSADNVEAVAQEKFQENKPEIITQAALAQTISSASTQLSKTHLTPIATTNRGASETIKPPVTPSRPKPPKKPWRERLPAPIAKFIFGGNTLVQFGVMILFLGLAFLLRYTAERITVPVEMRYTSVALVALGLLLLGWFLRHKRRDYALILQGMAIGVFYLTTLSAMKMHGLISSEVGFGFMLLVSVLSAALAVLQKAPMLAIIAALEGFITPILTSTGENNAMGLFSYLSILNIGIFCIAWFNAWRILNVIAFVGTFTLSIGWAQKYYTDNQYDIAQTFLIFFFLLFAFIGVLFARRTLLESRNEMMQQGNPLSAIQQVGRVDSALVFGNPITAFGLQYMLVKPFEFGAAFSALIIAFFYLILARIIFSKEKQGLALLAESYVIVAAIFGTLAIPLGLEGAWTSAAWAIEGAGMYWLGVRQSRPYARAFSYVVIAGATYKLLHAMTINPHAFEPLLQGALLGPILLAISVLTMWHLHRRATPESISSWEAIPSNSLPWLGMAALSCLPWMLLMPNFAAATVAMMAVILGQLGLRYSLNNLRPIAAVMQGLSLLAFLQTLHLNQSNTNEAVLADGWKGMIAAVIIAASILFNAARQMLKIKREAQTQNLPPNWPWWNGIAVVIACLLLHIAMLFAITMEQAAWIWPLTSCLLLWVSLRMSHTPLALLSLFLQLFCALLFCVLHLFFISDHANIANFTNTIFMIALSLAIAAWWCADQIQTEAKRITSILQNINQQNNISGKVWINPWCYTKWALWIPILWGLAWWLMAWLPETNRVLKNIHQQDMLMSAYVLIAMTTSGLFYTLAKIRSWQQIGVTTCVGLGLFMFSALAGIDTSTEAFLPSMNLGWLAWPVALVWHLFSLRSQQQWLHRQPRFQGFLHIVGFWFFLILAAREVQVRLAMLTAFGSSWALLGWVLIPALVLWLIGHQAFAKLWPLNHFRSSYVEKACAPVALYLLIWCWITNVISAGNAFPLPYIPLLNPLELAQCLILFCLLLWWRNLPINSPQRISDKTMKMVGATTAFVLLTGSIMRSVHHYAGVSWDFDVLFTSHLAQAALSITWAICGVSLMILGNRQKSRQIWMAGATLLGIVVIKLFLIELAERGGLYRIISFIGVGLALLVVGYFAPVPIKKPLETTPDKVAK